MPMVMEAIDKMSADERLRTMEHLWATMTRCTPPSPPAWHGRILDSRRRCVASGEETFVTLEESKRRFHDAVHTR